MRVCLSAVSLSTQHIFANTANSSNALVTGGGRDHYERAEAVVPVGDQSVVVAAPLVAEKSQPAGRVLLFTAMRAST